MITIAGGSESGNKYDSIHFLFRREVSFIQYHPRKTLFFDTFFSFFYRDGIGREARFNDNEQICMDSSGNIFVVNDPSIRKISVDGVVTTVKVNEGKKRCHLKSFFSPILLF